MGSRSTQLAAATKMTPTTVMTLEGHKDLIWSMAYFPDGKRIISLSFDNTVRQWDLQAGKEIEEVRDVYEGGLFQSRVSRDGRWVMISGGDEDYMELKACEVETGVVKTLIFQNSQLISCIDISTDGKLLASGSYDRTVLIWGMDTGEVVAGPFESDGVDAVRFSLDSKKLAVESDVKKCLEVWDVQTQKLDVRVGKIGCGNLARAPIFWTKKGTILAVFNFDFDNNHSEPTTIYEFDPSTLETVGDPFEGHTDTIDGLALSFDDTLLASSSFDKTVKLWSIEPRQLLASFHVQHERVPSNLIFSPATATRQLAYSADHKIFICSIPPDILASIRVVPDAQTIVRIYCIYLIVDVLISSSRSVHLTIQPLMTYSMCTPHCFVHLYY
jgi:WD40 repeat protein